MPPLTELIERVTSPGPGYYPHWWELSLAERSKIRTFCRQGFAELGLELPPKFRGDYIMIACVIRAIIRFGCTGGCGKYCLNSLTLSFHPDPERRKAAAAAEGFLFDDRSGKAIIDYGGTDAVLDQIGYRSGTA